MVHRCMIKIGGDVAAYISSVLTDVCVVLFGSSLLPNSAAVTRKITPYVDCEPIREQSLLKDNKSVACDPS